jgi:hypothetical protein
MNSARLPVNPAHFATQKPRGFLVAWTAGTIAGPMPQRVPAAI